MYVHKAVQEGNSQLALIGVFMGMLTRFGNLSAVDYCIYTGRTLQYFLYDKVCTVNTLIISLRPQPQASPPCIAGTLCHPTVYLH